MSKTGVEYLAEAAQIRKEAGRMRKADSAGAAALEVIAHEKVKSAIKRMKRRPRKRRKVAAFGA